MPARRSRCTASSATAPCWKCSCWTCARTEASDATAFLGREQLDWLKRELSNSRAVWKIVAADMPIGLNVGDGKDATGQARWEAVANGNNGAPAGRELEFAELLRHLKRQK